MTEINKDQVMQDLQKILEHLTIMNKEMQKLYIFTSEIVREVTKHG